MKKVLAMAVAAWLCGGCASFQQSVTAVGASAVVSVQLADDNALKALTIGLCATPFSAAVRNPQIVPALKALCLPSGSVTPATVLDSIPAAAKP